MGTNRLLCLSQARRMMSCMTAPASSPFTCPTCRMDDRATKATDVRGPLFPPIRPIPPADRLTAWTPGPILLVVLGLPVGAILLDLMILCYGTLASASLDTGLHAPADELDRAGFICGIVGLILTTSALYQFGRPFRHPWEWWSRLAVCVFTVVAVLSGALAVVCLRDLLRSASIEGRGADFDAVVVYGTFAVTALFLAVAVSMKKQRAARWQREYQEDSEAWEHAQDVWQRLYYCSRCDGVFPIEGVGFVDRQDLDDYLYPRQRPGFAASEGDNDVERAGAVTGADATP